jgi:hypothetical protein
MLVSQPRLTRRIYGSTKRKRDAVQGKSGFRPMSIGVLCRFAGKRARQDDSRPDRDSCSGQKKRCAGAAAGVITLRRSQGERSRRQRNSRTTDQQVAGYRTRSRERTGGELHDGEPSKGRREPPRTHSGFHLDHASITTHERDVDRKPHEEGVHGVRGSDDQGVPVGQRIAAEQPLAARVRVERGQQVIRDDSAGPRVLEDVRRRFISKQRTEE